MKKIFALVLVAMICATGFGKTIDEVFNAFPHADNVQVMTLDKAMLNMAGGNNERAERIRDIDSMRIIAIENATDEQKKIASDLMNDGVDGFDVMVDANENDEHALIFTQGNDKVINKMLIIASEKNEVAVVLIEGKINPDNASQMINTFK